jgi:hypothetical protein
MAGPVNVGTHPQARCLALRPRVVAFSSKRIGFDLARKINGEKSVEAGWARDRRFFSGNPSDFVEEDRSAELVDELRFLPE